jgi:HD-GYP domain-containing protein (c-di-GMP phosphodiesterase class II)
MTHAANAIAALATARRSVRLYPATHPAYDLALDELVSAVEEGTLTGPLVINVHQGRLYHESAPIPTDVKGALALAESFEARDIESLSLLPGFERSDALGLTEVLSLKPGASGAVAEELAARKVTRVTVSLLERDNSDEDDERDRAREADRALYQRALATLRALQARLSANGSVDLGETPGLVANVMQRLAEDPGAVFALATIRGISDASLAHALSVMIYSLALGRRLGLPDEGLTSLGLCALLHDIGKTAFDLEDPEQAHLCEVLHPRMGAEILQRVAPEDPAPLLVAFEHHMDADGGGWPEREAGYVAHPYSRMVAIANRYDNLVAPREGLALTPDKAVVQVLQEGERSLDPLFTRLFASALGALPVGCLVRLSDHSVGVVVRQGDDPLAPVVKITYDDQGREFEDRREIDLAQSEERIIEVVHPESLNVVVAEKL